MKPRVTNRLEKGRLPNSLQVFLKMPLKAPVIGMPPSPSKVNVTRPCRTCITKSYCTGHIASKSNISKVKTVCDKCSDPVCGNHIAPMCNECKNNIEINFIKPVPKDWNVWMFKHLLRVQTPQTLKIMSNYEVILLLWCHKKMKFLFSSVFTKLRHNSSFLFKQNQTKSISLGNIWKKVIKHLFLVCYYLSEVLSVF